MNEKLTEATILALQGKLTESVEGWSNEIIKEIKSNGLYYGEGIVCGEPEIVKGFMKDMVQEDLPEIFTPRIIKSVNFYCNESRVHNPEGYVQITFPEPFVEGGELEISVVDKKGNDKIRLKSIKLTDETMK